MTYKYDPGYAVHPGEAVKECMEMYGLTPHDVAVEFGSAETDWRVTCNLAAEITEIALGYRGIENNHAGALFLSCHVSVEFWLERQRIYDERFAELDRQHKFHEKWPFPSPD